jgi:hypothetical protein
VPSGRQKEVPFQQGFGSAELGENFVFGHDLGDVLELRATTVARFATQIGGFRPQINAKIGIEAA